MKHPTNEEWMGFIYQESSLPDQNRLQTHLRECALCRAQVEQWRQTAGTLDSWADAGALSPRQGRSWLKIAAVLVGCGFIGFAAGRQSVNTRELQANLEKQINAQVAATSAAMLKELEQKQSLALRQAATELAASQRLQTEQVVARVTEDLDEKRTEDQAVVQAALQRFASQYHDDYLSLRQGLETVAVMTEAGLQRAKQQLVNLATYQAREEP